MAGQDARKYLESKFSLLFQFYDTDGDGFLSTQDFEHREKLVGHQAGMNEEEIERYVGQMRPFYKEIIGSNKQQFSTKVADIILTQPRLHEVALKAKSAALFLILDRNQNGTLEPREFAFLMHSWLIRERDVVKELFELADRQKQEKLTQEDFYEFQAALRSPTRNRIADVIISHLEKLPEKLAAAEARQNGHGDHRTTAPNDGSEELSADMRRLRIPRAQETTHADPGGAADSARGKK